MKQTRSKRKKTAQSRYMSPETFAKLERSLQQALAYERGENTDVCVIHLARPPEPPKPISKKRIIAIRKRMNYSRPMFARLMNVSPRTVESWEQGLRTPSDAALKLLTVAERHPEVLLD